MVNYQMNKKSKVLLLFTLLINLVIKFDDTYIFHSSIYLSVHKRRIFKLTNHDDTSERY